MQARTRHRARNIEPCMLDNDSLGRSALCRDDSDSEFEEDTLAYIATDGLYNGDVCVNIGTIGHDGNTPFSEHVSLLERMNSMGLGL